MRHHPKIIHGDPSFAFASRREFLEKAGRGLGILALADLAGAAAPAHKKNTNPLSAKPSHFRPRCKRVIWLFMNGGPSQVDTWDYKPALAKYDGKEYAGFDKATGFFPAQVGPLMKSPFVFTQHGQSGTWVSELFPSIARHVDKMAFIHSCHTETNNHSPALFQINTGMSRMGFPCVGAWVMHGLGSESRDLPGFVTMTDPLGRGLPKGHAQNWGAGFLPGIYQGTALQNQGSPIEHLQRPGDQTDQQQRQQLDLLRRLNLQHRAQHGDDPELNARIESFELAYRMQSSAPEALDVNAEPRKLQQLYGMHIPKCAHFARQCLMARRLLERGVRFVQIYSGGMENQRSWDGHKDIEGNHRGFAAETDIPIAGLLSDLELRGMLEDTLVICCGEFGRLPVAQTGDKPGRDHNPHAFTAWFAGGGVKAGTHHGETDELGHKAERNKVSVNDLHATILHFLGMDHEKLTYRHIGRDFRLTDVAGRVVKQIIA